MITDIDQINMYRVKVIYSGLKLEVKTGMRHSSNGVFKAAKAITGEKTREKCLEKLERLLDR